MCEFASPKMMQPATDHFSTYPKHTIGEVFSRLRNKFPHSGHPGQCPVCGKILAQREKRPAGKCTRSMCGPCYERLIAGRINHNCFLCGGNLPNDKIMEQMKNPREIRAHMHEDICVHAWTIIHNIALAEPEVHYQDVLDPAQLENTGSQLVSSPQQFMLEDQRDSYFKVPIFKSYKSKKVKVIR